MTVAGYEIDRNEEGLTAREREVYDRLIAGDTFQEIGDAIGITRQRVGQVAAALVLKGALVRQGVGRYAVPIKRKGASA